MYNDYNMMRILVMVIIWKIRIWC